MAADTESECVTSPFPGTAKPPHGNASSRMLCLLLRIYELCYLLAQRRAEEFPDRFPKA